MAETSGTHLVDLGARSPLAGSAFGCDRPGLTMAEDPFRSLVEVRGERPSPLDGGFVWGLGPRWWLADGPPPAAPALEVPLARDLGGVDVSGQRLVVALSGPGAVGVLAAGCSLDLERVGVGEGVQGLLAGCQVVVGRVAPQLWRVYVRASFARHLAAWLTDAAGAR